MVSRAGRGGFTLIEMLVVIGTIGLLLSLLLPAVQQARESARVLKCRTHLKQMGLALHQYADVHSVFPRICLEGKGTSTYVTGWQGFSVHAMLLPFLDQGALYAQINFNTTFRIGTNQTTKNQVVPLFLCPSDFGGRAVAAAGNNYVVSGGPSLLMISPIPGQGAGGNPGISIREHDQIGMFNMRRIIRLQDLSDGLSNTVAMSEGIIGDGNPDRYSIGDLVRGTAFPAGFPNTFATREQLDVYGTQCRQNASQHYSDPHAEWINGMPAQTAFNTLNPPNSPHPDCHENTAGGWYDSRGVWTARSRHRHGVNILLADGSCRFLTSHVDLILWQRLGAIADAQPIPPF